MEDMGRPGVTGTLIKKYKDIAENQDEVKKSSFKTDKEIETLFLRQLQARIKNKSILFKSQSDVSADLAAAYATQLYRRNRKLNSEGPNPNYTKASIDAYNTVTELISKGEAQFEVISGATDKDITNWQTKTKGEENQKKDLKGRTFFGYFVPGPHNPTIDPLSRSTSGKNDILEKVIANPQIISEEPLVSAKFLLTQIDNLNKGMVVTIPKIYYTLSKDLPSLGTPREIFFKQLQSIDEKIEIKENTDFREGWLKQTDDPEAKKLIRKIDDINTAVQSYEIVFNNGASNPKYMSPRIKKVIVPKSVEEQINQPPEALTEEQNTLNSLFKESNGLFNPNDYAVRVNKNGKRSLTLNTIYNEGVDWLIENGSDYGWYYDANTGVFMDRGF